MRLLLLARPAFGRILQGLAARGTLLTRLAASLLCLAAWPVAAQTPGAGTPAVPALRLPLIPETAPAGSANGMVRLSALFAATDTQPVREGLQWRIFEEVPGTDGNHKLVAQSTDATPNLPLPNGNFVVHAALGLAGATKRIAVDGTLLNETLVLNAGGLRIAGRLGDTPINPAKLAISIYVPERGNPEAKLVVANAKSGDTIGFPEGNYHVVSTLLDAAANGSASPTNSVISADLRVQAGKLTDAMLRHRAATMTLKLVNSPGGEALANTAFTILTPGGDVIREMIGAFPAATLAEGEYVAIARHASQTYQTTFKVVSGVDKDVEFLANETPPPAAP
ncbi:MAG TPA: hypothetical protein VHT02_10365 [Methylocella sp.]|nr:hypothetical protein [Methylocella sp.]